MSFGDCTMIQILLHAGAEDTGQMLVQLAI